MQIEIISSELKKPSSPTPFHCRDYKLSFICERIPHSYIPLILYYPTPPNPSQLSENLKKSLSETLSLFYPLAGRAKDQISIDCNDEGVLYVESQVDGILSELIDCPDAEICSQLVPCKSCGTISSARELLAIQVNFFACGGIAIGICQSHRVADGSTMSSFILTWANAAAAGVSADMGMGFRAPLLQSASFFPPRNSVDFKPNVKSKSLQPPQEKLITKRFIFTSLMIELLRSEIMKRSGERKTTRVQAVSAWIWNCCKAVRGKGIDNPSVAFHPVNLRRRLSPPLPDSAFGNIFQMAFAAAKGGEHWVDLAGILRSATGKVDGSYCAKLLGENGYECAKGNFDEVVRYVIQKDLQIVRLSSWCGFPLYDADFGWGSPVWVSSTSYTCKDHAILFDSKTKDGIEAWICMAESAMPEFELQMEMYAADTN